MGYKSPKTYSLITAHAVADFLDATSYYAGNYATSAPSTTAAQRNIPIPLSGFIRAVALQYRPGTVGSNEAGTTFAIRVNDTTDYAIATTADFSQANFQVRNSNMNIPVSAGDFIQIKVVTTTWATNPLQTHMNGVIVIEHE